MWWVAAAWGQAVEMPEDQVLVSVRLRAMGGAVTGIAESASAQLYNPAAMAMRRPLLPQTRRDLDLALQLREHPVLSAAWKVLGIDPDPAPARRMWWQVGEDLRLGPAAIGVQLRQQSWEGVDGRYRASEIAAGAGWAWPTVAIGALPELVVWDSVGHGSAVGWGGSMGALIAPDGLPLRIGVGYRGPAETGETPGPGPTALRIAPEASVGASWSVGATNQASELGPARVQAREGAPMLLLAADLVATGPSRGAVPLRPLLEDRPPEPAGWTFGVRTGAEASLVRHQVRVRGGFTSVPGRGETGSARIWTGGAAVQLLEDPRGVPLRGVVGGEAGPDGVTFGFGLESW
jgi:hypothetical protein